MFIVGLTGGIGSGKSVVADSFKQLGIEVVDADIAAREVVKIGSSALQHIADHFGSGILKADGTLDRPQLRALIFDHTNHKQWLEALLHPLIKKWINQQLAQASSTYVILESPLLMETDQQQITNRILLVDVSEALQLERATARDNNTEPQIKAIMSSQMSRQERRQKADDILDNSGSLSHTYSQVSGLHQQYLASANTAKKT